MKFNVNHQVEPYTFILSRPDHKHFGELINVTDRKVNVLLNGADELSFTVYKHSDGDQSVVEPLWDKLVNGCYIYVPELNEYFRAEVQTDDEVATYKSVSAVGAAEYELSHSKLYVLEINSEEDIARDEYKDPTEFYNPDKPEASLLHRAFEKLPNWSFGNIDNSLRHIQRTFSVSNNDLYSFLTDEVAEEIGCLFSFDSVQRKVHCYDLKTVCLDCGHRGTFEDKCPKCNSKNLKGYGDETGVYLDSENFAKSITLAVDPDTIINCFRLEAGDDDMTAAVMNANPNGSAYIYYFSDDDKAQMPENLVLKLEQYQALCKTKVDEHQAAVDTIYECIDKILYYTSGMMPTVEHMPTTAAQEAEKLKEADLSPVGMPKITESTSLASVNSAIKSWAKAMIKSGWFKADINESNWTYVGIDPDGAYYGIWTGNFKVTNYSDETDTAISQTVSVKVWDKYHSYLEQKLEKYLNEHKDDDEKGSVYDVLSIKDFGKFKEAIKLYGLNRLQSFADAYQGCLDIIMEAGHSEEVKELYDELYLPYYNKLSALHNEISERQKVLDSYEERLKEAEETQDQIHEALDFRAFLGEDLYKIFLAYKKEDVYSNSNYVSTDLDNKTIFENAASFYEAAEDELIKAATHQHTISGNLIDFLAIPEFQPFLNNFEVGNWIRVGIDDQVYKLRLIKIGVDFENLEDVELEFSDVTRVRGVGDDTQGILNQAQSIAGSYSYTQNQVKKQSEQTDLVREFVNRGLDASVMKIVNAADAQTIVIDSHGLIAKGVDEFNDTFSDEQMKLFNAGLYYTTDNWRTAKAGIGHFIYYDPVTNEEKDGYGVIADTIVGNIILSKEVGIYNKNGSLKMDNGGFVLTTDARDGENRNAFTIQKTVVGSEGNESVKKMMYIDSDGNLRFDGSSFKISTGKNTSSIEELTSEERIKEIAGTAGNAVKSTTILYYESTSNTEPKDGVWSESTPVWKDDKYYWQKIRTELNDGTINESKPICIVGRLLEDGVGIAGCEIMYQEGTSGTDHPTGTWFVNIPPVADGNYLWTRTITYYTDGQYSTSYQVAKNGSDGKDGEDAILLMIDSSNGTLFKNSGVNTSLTVTIIVGDLTITNSSQMYAKFGNNAKLIWYQKQLADTGFTALSATDSRLSDAGFILTLTTHDVYTKAVFTCELDY